MDSNFFNSLNLFNTNKMKKIFLIILISICQLTLTNAQNDTKKVAATDKGLKEPYKPGFNLTYYPFAAINSAMMTGFEFDLKNGNSIKINTSVGYNEGKSTYYDNFIIKDLAKDKNVDMTNINSYGIQFQYRFNLAFDDKRAGNYYYVSPTVHYKNIKFDYNYSDQDNYTGQTINYKGSQNISAFGIGANIGYRYIAVSRFVFDVYIGGGLQQRSKGANVIPNPSLAVDSYRLGVFFAPGFSFGVKI